MLKSHAQSSSSLGISLLPLLHICKRLGQTLLRQCILPCIWRISLLFQALGFFGLLRLQRPFNFHCTLCLIHSSIQNKSTLMCSGSNLRVGLNGSVPTIYTPVYHPNRKTTKLVRVLLTGSWIPSLSWLVLPSISFWWRL